MSLKADILAWDGKSAADIGSVYDTHATSRAFTDRLIGFMPDRTLQTGATWLLKRHLEQGGTLAEPQADAFYGACPALEEWGACLHVLQCTPRVAVPVSKARRVAAFLDRCLTNRRPMVRAWAYWGYHELASLHARYTADAEALLLDAAASETAGSVKARVRKALAARGL